MTDDREGDTLLTAKTIARHALALLAVTVLLTAIAIWFGLGPVVHSAATH